MLDASRLADEDGPVTPMAGRRRGLVSSESGGGSGGGGGSVAGNTLFERMANLSRGTKAVSPVDEDDEEGDDIDGDSDSSAISIPRFLGRQNNQ